MLTLFKKRNPYFSKLGVIDAERTSGSAADGDPIANIKLSAARAGNLEVILNERRQK